MTAESASRRWLVTIAVMLVASMQVLDTSVTNVALPHMQGSLSASLDEITWVLTSFLAANGVILPATGWLVARLGRRRFFLLSTIVFMASSLLSGAATSLEFLVGARLLQGLGGGPLIPLSQAILMEIFPPHKRGMAMAIWGLGVMVSPIIGPTLGGWLTDNYSWRWIFYLNLPFGAVALALGAAFLEDSPEATSRRTSSTLDGVGLGLDLYFPLTAVGPFQRVTIARAVHSMPVVLRKTGRDHRGARLYSTLSDWRKEMNHLHVFSADVLGDLLQKALCSFDHVVEVARAVISRST